MKRAEALATAAADVLPQERLGEGIGYYGLGQAVSMSFGPALALMLANTNPPENLFVGLTCCSAVALALGLLVRYEHDPEGLPSQSTWKVMGRAEGVTWLALEPLTGRTHQLRVHCAESGFPVLGDNIYGSAPRSGGPRLHLHARQIVVPLYKNKPPIKVTAPVPEHMKERLRACGWTEDMDRDVNPPLGLSRPPRKEATNSSPQGERQ